MKDNGIALASVLLLKAQSDAIRSNDENHATLLSGNTSVVVQLFFVASATRLNFYFFWFVIFSLCHVQLFLHFHKIHNHYNGFGCWWRLVTNFFVCLCDFHLSLAAKKYWCMVMLTKSFDEALCCTLRFIALMLCTGFCVRYACFSGAFMNVTDTDTTFSI